MRIGAPGNSNPHNLFSRGGGQASQAPLLTRSFRLDRPRRWTAAARPLPPETTQSHSRRLLTIPSPTLPPPGLPLRPRPSRRQPFRRYLHSRKNTPMYDLPETIMSECLKSAIADIGWLTDRQSRRHSLTGRRGMNDLPNNQYKTYGKQHVKHPTACCGPAGCASAAHRAIKVRRLAVEEGDDVG